MIVTIIKKISTEINNIKKRLMSIREDLEMSLADPHITDKQETALWRVERGVGKAIGGLGDGEMFLGDLYQD